MLKSDATCLKDFRRIWSMSQDWPLIWKSHWKLLGWAKSWWGRASRTHQDGTNSMSQVDGISNREHAYWLCQVRAKQGNNGLYQHWFLGESCPLPALTLMLDNSISTHMPLVPFKVLPQGYSSEKVSLSKFMQGSFKLRGTDWDPRSSVSLSLNPHWVLQPDFTETSIPVTGPWAWV